MTARTGGRRSLAFGFLALSTMIFAGCSSGAAPTQLPGTSAAGVAGVPSVGIPATNAFPTSNSVAGHTDICALLPADEVAQITGEKISGSFGNNNFLTVNDARCQYSISSTSPGDDDQIVIDVISPGGTQWYDMIASQYPGNISAISGIGDKALQDFTDGTGLVALFGDTAYDVYVDNPNDLKSDDEINTASETLITTLRAKM